MEIPKASNLWVVPFTCLVALLFSAVSWPSMVQMWVPEWVLLVVVYWIMALPYRLGIGFAFAIGLLVDVLEGALLGSHAFALSFIAFWVLMLYQRVRMYPVVQQSLIVGLLTGVYLVVEHGINGFVGVASQGYWYLSPALASMFFWPMCFVILRGLRLQFRVK